MLTDERGKTITATEDYKLGLLADALERLTALSKRLRARYEWLCDNESDNADEGGNDLTVQRMQDKADQIAANVGLYVYHQTDCRGAAAAIYVSFFPIPDNNYTRAVCLG